MTEHHLDTRATVEAMFVASLSDVDALRDDTSSGAFFRAVAMCQEEYEAKLLDSEAATMRYYESSSLRLVDSPKG